MTLYITKTMYGCDTWTPFGNLSPHEYLQQQGFVPIFILMKEDIVFLTLISV